MRTHPVFESIGVMHKSFACRVHTFRAHFGAEFRVFVQTLGAGHDFLPAHEEVVAVCEGRVGGVGVCVEGAEGPWVLVYAVEVCGVLFEDEGA